VSESLLHPAMPVDHPDLLTSYVRRTVVPSDGLHSIEPQLRFGRETFRDEFD